MNKFVWDTSAIINIKETNSEGYSPGHSLMKDLWDGNIDIEYQNIFPTLAIFEMNAAVSKMHRKGEEILREFYIMDENSILYDVDRKLVEKSSELYTCDGFNCLYGADLVFACISYIEDAYLVTKDRKLALHASKQVKVIDLNKSNGYAKYREEFENA